MNPRKLRSRWAHRCTLQSKQAALLSFLSLSSFAYAVDYQFGDFVTQPFTIRATSHARALGTNPSIFNDNGLGSVFDRNSARDVTFLRFDLSPLRAMTLSGDASLRLPALSQFGGAVNNGVLNLVSTPWTYAATGAVPSFAPIADSPSLTALR